MRVRLVVMACVAGVVLLSSCRHVPITSSRSTGLPPREEALKADVAIARGLLDASLDWRGRAARFVAEVKPRLGAKGVLTSADLDALYRGGEDYVFLSRRWDALIDVQGDEAWRRAGPKLATDAAARTQTKLVLAAALVQYDDYALGVDPYFQEYKLRRLLKTDHESVLGEVDVAMRRFLDPVRRQRLARAVVWYRAEGGHAEGRSEDESFLDEVIQQSPGYRFISGELPERFVVAWRTGGQAAITYVTDLIAQTGATAEHATSFVVGNAVGLVQTRSGYLRELTAAEKAALRVRLRPGDVLLEKTPFRLTDKSIPGHYGHVAIWVGSEAELKALGVWDDPSVRLQQERIRAGAAIVEALRRGVEINTLEQFLNIDDLLVIRRAMTEEQTRAAVLRAFGQVGKDYDYNFDVESDRRIVCSELAFVVFTDVTWPTSTVLRRASITPDQVATRAIGDGPFVPVIVYHDGVEVRERLSETVDALLRGDRARFRELHPEFVGRSEARKHGTGSNWMNRIWNSGMLGRLHGGDAANAEKAGSATKRK
jgi:uncharacterized protein YycO